MVLLVGKLKKAKLLDELREPLDDDMVVQAFALDNVGPVKPEWVDLNYQDANQRILAGVSGVTIVGHQEWYQPLGVTIPPMMMVWSLCSSADRTPGTIRHVGQTMPCPRRS